MQVLICYIFFFEKELIMYRTKRILLGSAAVVASLIASSSALAWSYPGFYVGGAVGWGQVSNQGVWTSDMQTAAVNAEGGASVSVLSSDSRDKNQNLWAGRLYVGYQVDCHWAAEAGWSGFTDPKAYGSAITTDPDAPVSGDGLTNFTGSVHANQWLQTNAVDLVIKGSLPLQNNFSAYVKLGAAYLMVRKEQNLTYTDAAGTVQSSNNTNQNRWLPTYGLGLAYEFMPNVSADLAWNRIQKVSDGSTDHSTDQITVGLAYNLGES